MSAYTSVLEARAATGTSAAGRPPIYKIVGIILAVASGLFIGTSFVLKKLGLLQANKKYQEAAGEGYGYLRNWLWWVGMTLMILGEGMNFGAYAFVDAITVAPLGALSVVVTTILSTIFLKERLSFVGKIGCFNCIVGSVVIVLNAPTQSAVATIQDMKHYVVAPGFLTYTGLVVVGAAFTAFWVGPRYGKKTMLVYLSICSWIGGLSVVATQGLGAAIVAQAGGTPQFNQWFLYVVLVFVICTLVTEIIFLNKALNLFNAALVTPTYYVYFTTCTIISSAVLFRGFKGTPLSITTVVMGFLQICSGVVLLQLAKSSKDVPDTAVFKGDLDQVRTIAEQEEPESEPRADTIRGSGALLRVVSQRRAKREMEQAKSYHHESMQPIAENEIAEWDGLRRRKTVLGQNAPDVGGLQRSKSIRPPLGMSKIPDDVSEAGSDDIHPGFFPNFGRRTSRKVSSGGRASQSHVPMTGIHISDKGNEPSRERSQEHVYGLPDSLRLPVDGGMDTSYKGSREHIQWDSEVQHKRDRSLDKDLPPRPPTHRDSSAQDSTRTNSRAFSFNKVFHRPKSDASSIARMGDVERFADPHTPGRPPTASRLRPGVDANLRRLNTEEERFGLARGDSPPDPASYIDSSPVASPERPLMQSHKRSERGGSNLRVAYSGDGSGIGRDSDDSARQALYDRTEHDAVGARMADVRPPAYAPDPRPNNGSSPRRGYQRGRYVDSDDEDDGTDIGPPRHGNSAL